MSHGRQCNALAATHLSNLRLCAGRRVQERNIDVIVGDTALPPFVVGEDTDDALPGVASAPPSAEAIVNQPHLPMPRLSRIGSFTLSLAPWRGGTRCARNNSTSPIAPRLEMAGV